MAMLASQFPYGRVIGLGIAGVGFLIGLGCLIAEGRAQLLGAAAMALHLVAIGLLLFAPSWLGLVPWRTPAGGGPEGPHSVELGTHAVGRTDRIDASKASWAFDDIRVSVRTTGIGPIELVDPSGARRQTRESYLKILVRVANTGVSRRVELSGWAANTGLDAVRLTDPAGKALKLKAFDAGWSPAGVVKATGVVPGQSAEIVLVYEPPTPVSPKPKAARVEHLRLELPGQAVGTPDPIRFHIPGPF